jgi:hypothetical protein
MVSESGEDAEYNGEEGRAEGRETKQHERAHEHDASISLEITRRTDGYGFFWARHRQNPTLGRPLLHTLTQKINRHVRHLSNLFSAWGPDPRPLYLELSVQLLLQKVRECFSCCLLASKVHGSTAF